MSILIMGIEMPKACYECRMYEADIYYCAAAERDIDIPSSDEGRCSFCPLVPVPPHGRLIDVDYADEYAYDELEIANSYLTGWEAARAMQKIYRTAPTIIPADDK